MASSAATTAGEVELQAQRRTLTLSQGSTYGCNRLLRPGPGPTRPWSGIT